MSSDDVLHMFPSRANYTLVKTRLVLIEKGYVLLKRKRDALEVKLRKYSHELDSLRESSMSSVREAIFTMARINYLGVDLRHVPMLDYPQSNVYLKLAFLKLIGVTVPKFNINIRDTNSGDYTGLSRGGLAVLEARKQFQFALEELTNYASVEYTVKVLQEGMRVNNMRVNGMEFVLIPRYHNTLKYILEEIDEFDRQDFYRLKRSQTKRLAKIKEEMIDMRDKRDNPEEHAKKETEKERKRYSLPHWKSILTPKQNVNLVHNYLFRPRKHFVHRMQTEFNDEEYEDELEDEFKENDIESNESQLDDEESNSSFKTESDESTKLNSDNSKDREDEDGNSNVENEERVLNVADY